MQEDRFSFSDHALRAIDTASQREATNLAVAATPTHAVLDRGRVAVPGTESHIARKAPTGAVSTLAVIVALLTAPAFAVDGQGPAHARDRTIKGSPPAKAQNARATHFTFKKLGRLIATPSDMPTPGPYYTTLVSMKEVPEFPFDYALYFSTDHHGGQGGIWLYVCRGVPTESANWRSYDQAVADGDFDYIKSKPAKNPIFVDRTQGKQTETPHVNVINHAVYMTYHNLGAGHNQSTLLATSKDGVNFLRINGKRDSVILDYDPKKEIGNGHTGYFRWRCNPFPGVDHRYIGYSLHGGGDDFHGAMWASSNAKTWQKIQVFDALEGHAVEGDRIVRRRAMDVHSVTSLGNGEFVALCSMGHRSSGGRARVLELYEMYLADDGMSLTRNSRKVLSNGPAGSYDAEELSSPTTVRIGNTWHLIYVGTSKKGRRNTIMAARGTLNVSAPKSTRLAPHERQRDVHRP